MPRFRDCGFRIRGGAGRSKRGPPIRGRQMRVIGIIPARLAATRLPDKPLLDIGGKPMIQLVWEQARKAAVLSEVYVATPDERIAAVVSGFGGIPIMTSADHCSG